MAVGLGSGEEARERHMRTACPALEEQILLRQLLLQLGAPQALQEDRQLCLREAVSVTKPRARGWLCFHRGAGARAGILSREREYVTQLLVSLHPEMGSGSFLF